MYLVNINVKYSAILQNMQIELHDEDTVLARLADYAGATTVDISVDVYDEDAVFIGHWTKEEAIFNLTL